jgi:hypothetical protein
MLCPSRGPIFEGAVEVSEQAPNVGVSGSGSRRRRLRGGLTSVSSLGVQQMGKRLTEEVKAVLRRKEMSARLLGAGMLGACSAKKRLAHLAASRKRTGQLMPPVKKLSEAMCDSLEAVLEDVDLSERFLAVDGHDGREEQGRGVGDPAGSIPVGVVSVVPRKAKVPTISASRARCRRVERTLRSASNLNEKGSMDG